jgi:hypothetical protein
MRTAAWWDAYFGGSVDFDEDFSIAGGSLHVVGRGTERRIVVTAGGETYEAGGGVMTWDALRSIEGAIPHPDRKDLFVALAQRFTWTIANQADEVTERLVEAHRSIGAVADADAFVERTLVLDGFPKQPAAPVARLLDAAAHATPALAYATDFDAATSYLRASRTSEDTAQRIEHLRKAAQLYFAAGEQPVDDADRADALSYSGAMLVELGRELPDAEAVLLFEQAAHRLEIASRLDPSHVDTRRRISDAFHHLGDRFCDNEPARAARIYAQAARYAREVGDDTPETLDLLVSVETMHADCLLRSDQPAEGKAVLAQTLAIAARIPPSLNTACVLALADRHDEAISALEVAAPAKGLTAAELLDNDFFDVLHGNPRWDALLATLASAPDAS